MIYFSTIRRIRITISTLQAVKKMSQLSPITRSYVELHIAVIFWGFSAILGDLIELSWFMITWWRVVLASGSLIILCRLFQADLTMTKTQLMQYAGIGMIVAVHWLTFFGSIQYANASVALITYATAAFMISILEPLILRTQISKIEVCLGVVIILAMAMVVQGIDLSMRLGLILGLISAFLSALFGVVNKKLVTNGDPLVITTVEMIAAALFLSLLLPIWLGQTQDQFLPVGLDWVYLSVLAFGCTSFAFLISIRTLQHISAFAQSVVMNLEPIYGIILAIIILGDNKDLTFGFYVGALIIMCSVLGYPYLKRKLIRTSEISH